MTDVIVYLVWLRISDEGSVPEIRIWSILLIKYDLKWCIHLSRSLFLYSIYVNNAQIHMFGETEWSLGTKWVGQCFIKLKIPFLVDYIVESGRSTPKSPLIWIFLICLPDTCTCDYTSCRQINNITSRCLHTEMGPLLGTSSALSKQIFFLNKKVKCCSHHTLPKLTLGSKGLAVFIRNDDSAHVKLQL